VDGRRGAQCDDPLWLSALCKAPAPFGTGADSPPSRHWQLGSAVEKHDQKNDRDRHADQPEQKSTSHDTLPSSAFSRRRRRGSFNKASSAPGECSPTDAKLVDGSVLHSCGAAGRARLQSVRCMNTPPEAWFRRSKKIVRRACREHETCGRVASSKRGVEFCFTGRSFFSSLRSSPASSGSAAYRKPSQASPGCCSACFWSFSSHPCCCNCFGLDEPGPARDFSGFRWNQCGRRAFSRRQARTWPFAHE